jgi:PAS domain S-box-containing protein
LNRRIATSDIATGEEALAFLDTVVANGPVGYALLNTELRFLWINDRLAQMNGLSAQEHIGLTAEEILGPERWPTRKPLLECALAGQGTGDITLTGIRGQISGREPRVLVSYTPIRVRESIVGVGVAVRDVTAQVEAEINLRQQSAAFENMWDALIISDLDGLIIQCNTAFTRLSGYSRAEAIGQPISMLYRPEDRERIIPEIANAIVNIGKWEGEIPYIRKDGTSGINQTSVVPLKDEAGTPIGLVGANRDITSQKQAEASLAASYQRYRFLADAMPQIVWTALANGQTDYFNPRWAEYTGIADGGSNDQSWILALHPDDLSPMLTKWATSVKTGEGYEDERRLRRADGNYRWHLLRALPMRDSNGHIAEWVGTCTDIDDQKQSAHQQWIFLRDMLASVTEGKLRLCASADDLPTPLELAGDPIIFDTTESLRTIRHLAQDAAQALGFADIRWQHLITATSEVAMNAIQHAGGGMGRVCFDGIRTVQVWIEDTGGGITVQDLPRATLERGWSNAGTLGHGFWLTLQTVDRVYLLTSASGTTVVLEQDCVADEPNWFRD